MDGNLSDLLSQISGLLAFTCGAGILWIFLMVWISRRNAERKRRAQEGLPPLPEFSEVFMNWVRGSRAATAGEQPQRPVRPSSADTSLADFVPTPDLSMLLSDLPEPPLPDVEPVEPPAKSVTPEPQPAVISPSSAIDIEAQIPIAAVPPAPVETAPSNPPVDSVELLRVWRDMPTGALIVEINGRRFETVNQIRNTELERRFSSVIRELNIMLQHPRPDIPPAPSRTSSRPVVPPPAQESPSMKPGTMFRQMGRAAMGQTPQTPDEKPALSIADQIEALLQARLVNLPAYSRRTIHVRPSIGGTVRIEVDGNFYDGIGDVTDPDVRELLMDVVREWESQQ